MGTDWHGCVVTDEKGCVLGVVLPGNESADPDAVALDIMRPGPSTKRPDEPLGPLVERMKRGQVDQVLVTSIYGRLLGGFRLEDAEAHLEGRVSQADWTDCEGCRGSWQPKDR